MRRALTALLLVGLAISSSGCVANCRGPHVGYYGGVHPGRCAVY